MMKKNYFYKVAIVLGTLLFCFNHGNAQVKIGDNEATILSGSLLELESTNKALTLPRMTTTQMNAISAPVNGMFIYNITDSCVYQHHRGGWQSLCADAYCGTVLVDLADPNLGTPTFTPDDPANPCILYVSEANGGTWIYDALSTSYISKNTDVEPWFNMATRKQSESLTDHMYHFGSANLGTGYAPGKYSLTVGRLDTVTASYAIAVGSGHNVSGDNSAVFGTFNKSSNSNNLVSGQSNIATSSHSVIGGIGNKDSVQMDAIFGAYNVIHTNISGFGLNITAGSNNHITGLSNVVSGNANEVYNAASDVKYTAVFGTSNVVAADASAAWGQDNDITGVNAAAWGNKNIVIGTNGASFGYSNYLKGDRSAAWGDSNTVIGINAAAWGDSNNITGNNSAGWGYGNTLTGDLSTIFGTYNTSMGNQSNTWGTSNLDSGTNTAVWGTNNMAGVSASQSATWGSYNINFGKNSAAWGNKDTVTGSESAAWGNSNNVSGTGSAAWGDKNKVSGSGSASWGLDNTLDADYSLAFGFYNRITSDGPNGAFGSDNVISANHSYLIGTGNSIASQYSMAIGNYDTIGSSHHFSLTLGRGVSTSTENQFVAGFYNGYRLYSNVANTVGVQLPANATTWSSISDRRSKEKIVELNYGLSEVMKMKPSYYNYKGIEKNNLGFIAQELLEVVPEVVDVPENKEEMMSVRYTELIPVLTKAIQELKAELDVEKAKNISLEAKCNKLEASLSEIELIKTALLSNGIEIKQAAIY